MSTQAKIWFVLGFVCSLCAYSLFPYLWDSAFYHLTSFAFVCYLRALYFQVTGQWSFVVFIVWLSCVDSFIDEMFFDPQLITIREYISFLLIIFISFRFKKKWTR